MPLRQLSTGQYLNLGGGDPVSADGYSDEVNVIQAGGSVAHYITAQLVADNTPGAGNEHQSITFGGAGLTSFTLTYDGQTTASIDFAEGVEPTAAEIQTALEALSNLAPGDVIVTGDLDGPFDVEFAGTLADTNVAEMTATPTGGTGTVTIATVSGGGTGTLDATIEGSFDQVNWFTIATFTQLTTTAGAEVETVAAGVVPPYLRANYNVGGSNPSYDFDLWLAVS